MIAPALPFRRDVAAPTQARARMCFINKLARRGYRSAPISGGSEGDGRRARVGRKAAEILGCEARSARAQTPEPRHARGDTSPAPILRPGLAGTDRSSQVSIIVNKVNHYL